MLISKSNAWSNCLATSVIAFALIFCVAASAQASNGGGGGGAIGGGGTGGGGSGSGGRGGQQAAGQQANGGAILDPATAFGNEVTRTGAVGQFTEAVGASATSAAASLSTTGRRAGGRTTGRGLGGMGGGLGAAFSNNLNAGATGGNESALPLRTRLRSGIVLPPASIESRISQEINVNNRLQRTSTLHPQARDRGQYFPGPNDGLSGRPLYGVNVQMQGRTAILQGTVSSPADRRMSELLIRLEPGVSQVENRINVAQ